MYGKTVRSSHYLPRSGSYSTVPHRNGRVDVLPPSATVGLHEIEPQREALKEKLGQLSAKLSLVKARIEPERAGFHRQCLLAGHRKIKRPPSLISLQNEQQSIVEEIQGIHSKLATLRELKETIERPRRQNRAIRFEKLFFDIARARLPDDVFQAIKEEVHRALPQDSNSE